MRQGKATTAEEKSRIIEKIADKMIEGASLRQACKEKGMPSVTTVMRWLDAAENSGKGEERELVRTIARARSLQTEAKFADMDDIIADVKSGALKPEQARVMLWALQWQLAKLKPKKYGEKKEVENYNYEVTPDDRMAAAHYGLSPSEYVQRREAGTLPDAPPVPDLH